jgi:hypothetical protein
MNSLTQEEKRAVAALKRLAKNWPGTLWLFVDSGGVNVMKYDESGEKASTWEGGFDPDFSVAYIQIDACGGQF